MTGCVVSTAANWYMTGGIAPTLVVDTVVVLRAVFAPWAAILLTLGIALIGSRLDERIEIKGFRIGSGTSLALVPFSVAGILSSMTSLATFGLAVVFAPDFDSTP